MTPKQAIDSVRKHGIVLESAAGAVPSLVEELLGARPSGSWWAHPRSHEIFALTRAVRDSRDVLTCRLIAGKVTFVHRRLWPALVRVADRLPKERLAWVREEHTASGRHVTKEDAFPRWVQPEVAVEASRLSETEATRALGEGFTRACLRTPRTGGGRAGR